MTPETIKQIEQDATKENMDQTNEIETATNVSDCEITDYKNRDNSNQYLKTDKNLDNKTSKYSIKRRYHSSREENRHTISVSSDRNTSREILNKDRNIQSFVGKISPSRDHISSRNKSPHNNPVGHHRGRNIHRQNPNEYRFHRDRLIFDQKDRSLNRYRPTDIKLKSQNRKIYSHLSHNHSNKNIDTRQNVSNQSDNHHFRPLDERRYELKEKPHESKIPGKNEIESVNPEDIRS